SETLAYLDGDRLGAALAAPLTAALVLDELTRDAGPDFVLHLSPAPPVPALGRDGVGLATAAAFAAVARRPGRPAPGLARPGGGPAAGRRTGRPPPPGGPRGPGGRGGGGLSAAGRSRGPVSPGPPPPWRELPCSVGCEKSWPPRPPCDLPPRARRTCAPCRRPAGGRCWRNCGASSSGRCSGCRPPRWTWTRRCTPSASTRSWRSS